MKKSSGVLPSKGSMPKGLKTGKPKKMTPTKPTAKGKMGFPGAGFNMTGKSAPTTKGKMLGKGL